MFLHADSEDSDQTGRMLRLIRVCAGRKGQFVGFVMRRLIIIKPQSLRKRTKFYIGLVTCFGALLICTGTTL